MAKYRLHNVIRVANDPAKIEKLKRLGYREVIEDKPVEKPKAPAKKKVGK